MAYTTHGHYVPGTNLDDRQPESVARCGGPAICTKCSVEAMGMIRQAFDEETELGKSGSMELEYFDENTLLKVYAALGNAGLNYRQCMDSVNAMLNEGILFREHRPD